MSRRDRDRDRDSDCKVYVGDLSHSTTKQDLEEAFRAYGPLKNVWVARHPPGFAFIEFDDARDADDSVRGLDGRTICGRRVRVEPSNAGRRRSGGGRGPPPRRGRPYHPEDKCYQCGERGHYARDCTQYDRRGRSRRTRSSSRSRSRDRRSRSRSGKSRSKSRSRSRAKKSRSRERQRSRERPRSADRQRSESSRSRSGTPAVKKSKPNGN